MLNSPGTNRSQSPRCVIKLLFIYLTTLGPGFRYKIIKVHQFNVHQRSRAGVAVSNFLFTTLGPELVISMIEEGRGLVLQNCSLSTKQLWGLKLEIKYSKFIN